MYDVLHSAVCTKCGNTQDPCPRVVYLLMGKKVNKIISASYKGRKTNDVVESDRGQEVDGHVREAGQRGPGGWRLRRSQPDGGRGQCSKCTRVDT